MAEITQKDIDDTLHAAGVGVNAETRTRPAPPTNDDIDETLRQAGIFPESPAERAAMRLRGAVQRTRPPPGPDFPGPVEPEPGPEIKALAARRGYPAQVIGGIPIASPLLDRAGGALAAVIQNEPGTTLGQRYDRNLDMSQRADKYFAHEHPIGSTIANLGGAIGSLGPLAATRLGGIALGARGPTTGARAYAGAGGGALIGGTDAALRGESVPSGMMIGAGGGAVGPLIGEGARSLTRGAATYLWPRTGALKDVNPGAVNKLTAALEGETPASIAAGRDRMGPQGFLGDLNTGMTDIAGGLADTPGVKGIVREPYRVRAAQQATRIDDALTKAMGPKVDMVDLAHLTTEGRKKAADPLYEQWRTSVVKPTDEIKALMPRLEKAGAFRMAEELADITGEPITRKFFTGGPLKDFPTAQTWDYVKRGLDHQIETAYSAGNKTKARALIDLKNEMLAEVEKAPGGAVYRKARETFADHSALLDQQAAGKDTFLGSRSGLSVDEFKHELKTLSGPELQMRIVGARNAAAEAMGETTRGDTTLRNKLLAPNNKEKMELLLGKPEAEKLHKAMEREKYLGDQHQNVSGGSQTTPKKERVNALQPPPLPEWNPNITQPLSFIPPSWIDALRPSTIMEARNAEKYGKVNNQLAHLITMPEGPKMTDLIQALQAETVRQAGNNKLANRVGAGFRMAPLPLSNQYRRDYVGPPAGK